MFISTIEVRIFALSVSEGAHRCATGLVTRLHVTTVN